MKILQVITSMRTGGAEKLLVDMVPLYRERGIDVDVLLFDGSDTSFKHQLEENHIKVYSLSKRESVYNPLLVLQMIPYLRKYDIVHTHNTACQLFAAIGSLLCSVVLCTTEHTTSNRRRDLKWYAPLDRWMYSRYKRIISISPATTEELKKHVQINIPIITIPNGIDVKKYSSASPIKRESLGCREDAFLLMMVAGFRYQKDQDTVIRAMKLLPENVELCFVGDGVRRKDCEQQTLSLGLQKRIFFTGVLSNIPNILKAADIIVMSSHYEGFGLAAVEGMAAGKPVVASDVIGLGDIVKGYGIVFPHSDEKALAKNIEKLMTDKEYYKAMAKRCQERAKDFDIHKMVDAYIDVYKSIAPQKQSDL